MPLMYSMIIILTTHFMSSNYVIHSLMSLNSISLFPVMSISLITPLSSSILSSLTHTKIHYFITYFLINIHYSYMYNNYFLNILFTSNPTAKTKMMSNCILQIIVVPRKYYLNTPIIMFNMSSG